MHELFDFPTGSVEADAWEKSGGSFEPDIHFTGRTTLPELFVVNSLLRQFGADVVAHHAYQPFHGTFSLELQFGSDDADGSAADCLQAYRSNYDDEGRLLASVVDSCRAALPPCKPPTSADAFSFILCRVGKPAEYVHANRRNKRDPHEVWEEFLNAGVVEYATYPFDRRLVIACDEYGRDKKLRYNRAGIFGDFAVVKRHRARFAESLSLAAAVKVAEQMNDDHAFRRPVMPIPSDE